MRSNIALLCPLLLLLICISCSEVKKESEEIVENAKTKGEELVEKAKQRTQQELEEQTQRVVDKVFPPFDHDKPDTENNKQRFRDFIKVEITPDVKNIYCYDEAIGIDASYMFAFNCSPATSEKIIKTNRLSLDTINTDHAFGLQNDFPWWNKDRIAELPQYSWTDGNNYYKYYWYDPKAKKAYFFDFDM